MTDGVNLPQWQALNLRQGRFFHHKHSTVDKWLGIKG
jgi:hypothetical protein